MSSSQKLHGNAPGTLIVCDHLRGMYVLNFDLRELCFSDLHLFMDIAFLWLFLCAGAGAETDPYIVDSDDDAQGQVESPHSAIDVDVGSGGPLGSFEGDVATIYTA